MKPVKKIFLAIVAIITAVSFTSCDDDDYYPYYSQLPDAANAFLSQYFYNYDIVDIDVQGYGTSTTYGVYFDSGAEAYFDYYGNWYYIQAAPGWTIPSGIVPYNIENYVYNYFYPAAGINIAQITNWGYQITLTDWTVLNFDPSGYPL